MGFLKQKIKQKTPLKSKPKHKPKKHFEKKLLDVQFKEFSQEELQFWWEKGQITPEVLITNQVKSLKSFKIQIGKKQSTRIQKLILCIRL